MASEAVTETMFRSVGQALSIAFSVAESPASVKGTTDRALKDLSERRYGAAPRIDADRTLNRDGLKDNEFRAQCVLVIRMVDDRLAGHARDTIIARYSKTVVKRAYAVRNLRDHFASLCNTQHRDAILALCWAIYAPSVTAFPNESVQDFNVRRKRRELEWSTRSIEKEYGVGRSVLRRDQGMLRELFREIETRALETLEMAFIAAGLLPMPDSD